MGNPAGESFARLAVGALGASARGHRRVGELMTTKVESDTSLSEAA